MNGIITIPNEWVDLSTLTVENPNGETQKVSLVQGKTYNLSPLDGNSLGVHYYVGSKPSTTADLSATEFIGKEETVTLTKGSSTIWVLALGSDITLKLSEQVSPVVYSSSEGGNTPLAVATATTLGGLYMYFDTTTKKLYLDDVPINVGAL